MASITKRFTNGINGIEQWRKVVRAAGQQIIDNADRIVADAEGVRSIEITIKGLNHFEFPVIEVKKDYNITELHAITEREDEV